MHAKAVSGFNKAAEQGHLTAQLRLAGMLLSSGQRLGHSKDISECLEVV